MTRFTPKLRVLLWVGQRSEPFTRKCLARHFDVSKMTAQRWLRELVGLGVIELWEPADTTRAPEQYHALVTVQRKRE